MADKKNDGAETAQTVDPKATSTKAAAVETPAQAAPQLIVSTPGAEVAKATDTAIIFKAKRPLDKGEFELLSDMVKHENEKTGLKIVLMPYSCDIVEDSGS